MAGDERFVLRALAKDDFDRGYIRLLGQLTVVGDVSNQMFNDAMQRLDKLGGYHHVVIEDTQTGMLVATGTLLIEQKFIRNCGKAGHVEDVVVDQSFRGYHLGQRIIEALTRIARDAGCYKVILDCNQDNAVFYEKCGYSRKEIQMVKYF